MFPQKNNLRFLFTGSCPRSVFVSRRRQAALQSARRGSPEPAAGGSTAPEGAETKPERSAGPGQTLARVRCWSHGLFRSVFPVPKKCSYFREEFRHSVLLQSAWLSSVLILWSLMWDNPPFSVLPRPISFLSFYYSQKPSASPHLVPRLWNLERSMTACRSISSLNDSCWSSSCGRFWTAWYVPGWSSG